jgi:radical SAM superfamily enzyme YgiQ (UPF0313 family)
MNVVDARLELPGRPDGPWIDAFIAQRFPSGVIRKILFVNPPDGTAELFRFETAQRGRYPNYPPYGLGSLAQHVRELGIACDILNLNHEVLTVAHQAARADDFSFDATWQKALVEKIEAYKPDLICVTCMFTMTHQSFKRVCESAAQFGVPISVGGVHVTNDVERVLDDVPAIDIAFTQEADVSLVQFCRFVAKEIDDTGLGQVIFNDHGDRRRFLTLCRPSPETINIIPAYDLMSISQLSQVGTIGNFYGFKKKGTRFATALSNRGCRAQCTFCSVRNFNGKTVRQRSVDSVLDELDMLHSEYGIGHITWLDDDLLKDHARAISLFNGIVKRGLDITWDATNGVIAASCTDEVVHAMAGSGCIALNIGMESGNPEILKQIHKPGTVKNFLSAAEVLRKYPQIHARVFLMIGFPGETLAMINDTISVGREMDLDWCGVTVLQPLPNTPIYDSMVAQGLIDVVGSTEVRFNAGGYGKQNDIDAGSRLATKGFRDAFSSIPMDAIPNAQQLTDIWFYMNYHLNFHRLFTEERRLKIEQQLQNLNTLSDVISPEHGLALYFIGYLNYRLNGFIDPVMIDRLEKKLSESDYWSERLEAFGLSPFDLRTTNFKNKEIPRLLPGVIPEDNRVYEDLLLKI